MRYKEIIYKDLSKLLKDKVSELLWVDKEQGQFDSDREFDLPMPAATINFNETRWQKVGKTQRNGEVVIQIRTAYLQYAQSHVDSSDFDEALKFWDFNAKVVEALEGMSGSCYSSLELISDLEPDDHRDLIVSVFLFSTNVSEGVKQDKNLVEVEPDIDVKRVSSIERPSKKTPFIL
jgi:hypothetical protein